MRIVEVYSHLNGREFLQVHHPKLWTEIKTIITTVDANACRGKISKEKRILGKDLFSPTKLNAAMEKGFSAEGWKETRTAYWVCKDARVNREVLFLEPKEQKAKIKAAGLEPLRSSNQTDFVKDKVAVEIQFGKYAFVAFDLFVKHMAFYVANLIDVGVEVLPMKELQQHMSSGIGYYERELYNVIREGRGVPAVPLILIGIAP